MSKKIIIRDIDGDPIYTSSRYGMRSAVEEAVIKGTDLSKADLRKTNLTGADLRKADFRNANLRGADLHGADLRNSWHSPKAYCPSDMCRRSNTRSTSACSTLDIYPSFLGAVPRSAVSAGAMER